MSYLTIERITQECPSVTHIFRTPNAGDEVENGFGDEFELKEFAVFTSNRQEIRELERVMWDEYHSLSNDIMAFNNVTNISALSSELYETDGYELVWSK